MFKVKIPADFVAMNPGRFQWSGVPGVHTWIEVGPGNIAIFESPEIEEKIAKFLQAGEGAVSPGWEVLETLPVCSFVGDVREDTTLTIHTRRGRLGEELTFAGEEA